MSNRTPSTVVEAWLQYENMRKQLEEVVKELELSHFNLIFGSKTEVEFRAKIRQARILLEKIDALMGPERSEPAHIA
jgi:hypothetical protein